MPTGQAEQDRIEHGERGLRVERLLRAGLVSEAFSVAPGECLTVTGPSGSGKTLLLRAIADLDPNEGDVCADGGRRDGMPAPAWRRRVMYLAAESAWWCERVAEHFPDPSRLAALAPELGLPADCGEWPVARLSSGERQRLALARALVLAPRVLLLDEPTAALDPEGVARVEAVVGRHLGDSACALWVTHDAEQARRLNPRRRIAVAGGHARVETVA